MHSCSYIAIFCESILSWRLSCPHCILSTCVCTDKRCHLMHDSPVIPYIHLLHETLQPFKYLLYSNISAPLHEQLRHPSLSLGQSNQQLFNCAINLVTPWPHKRKKSLARETKLTTFTLALACSRSGLGYFIRY